MWENTDQKKNSVFGHISHSDSDTYLNSKCNIFQLENVLSINELKDAFYSLKTNKSPRYDNISSNIMKQCFGILKSILNLVY